MIDKRIAIMIVASIACHAVLARALEALPPRPVPRIPTKIVVNVVEPPPKPPAPEPPPPEPTPTPPPTPEPPRVKPTPKATPRPTQPVTPSPTPNDSPAAPTDVTVPASGAKPKFGVSMSSTSTAGKTEAPVGNTSRPTEPSGPADDAKPLAPAAAHEVTKMPLPQGRCAGKYTEAARAAGVEGVVVLDLIVDENGKAREISVVQGLEQGLTEAAVAALRACQFSPGERGGAKVPVRVRGFKIRFLLGEG
jgi:protein TonB